ncbi:APG6-domain-containing protein [Chiua virens]|nr:APG6-domain-containing protein [Chiua virens]
MSYVCQQCKEPLQLDASLVDLSPSQYDMLAASLPPAPSTRVIDMTEAEQLARLPSSPASKAAWQHAKHQDNAVASPPLSSRAQGKQPQSNYPAPNESFVLLQDSVIRNIPSPLPPNTAPRPTTTPSNSAQSKSPPPPPSSVPTEPGQPNPTPISHHLRSTMRLFNLLTSRTDIDHPLCAECTQILLSTLQRQLEETKKERDGYLAFEKEVKKERERESQDMSRDEAEKKIEKFKAEERVAIEQLRLAERERDQLDEELRVLESEEQALEEEEDEFWRTHSEHQLASVGQAALLSSLRAAYAADYAAYEKLERTNVYNDAFCIGHDGVFGTINGLRLGRVPGVPVSDSARYSNSLYDGEQVEWPEINAAWGQTLLLLYTIGRKLDFRFDKYGLARFLGNILTHSRSYRLIPMGSFSRIERTTGDKATYEIYGSGDLHFGRLLHNRRFDFAMVAFLECLKQLMDYVKSQDAGVEFPHQIVKDKIGEASVKLQFSQEEAWTRALRHVLLALKIILKWTTNGGNG